MRIYSQGNEKCRPSFCSVRGEQKSSTPKRRTRFKKILIPIYHHIDCSQLNIYLLQPIIRGDYSAHHYAAFPLPVKREMIVNHHHARRWNWKLLFKSMSRKTIALNHLMSHSVTTLLVCKSKANWYLSPLKVMPACSFLMAFYHCLFKKMYMAHPSRAPTVHHQFMRKLLKQNMLCKAKSISDNQFATTRSLFE